MTILAFIGGLLIGGTLGILIMALCHVSGRESDREERGMTYPPPNPVDRSPWKATAPVPVTIENVGKAPVNNEIKVHITPIKESVMEEKKETSIADIAVMAAKMAQEINEKAGDKRVEVLHAVAGLLGFKLDIKWGF